MSSFAPIEDAELFEFWLMNMDDALESFLERLPNDLEVKLDYSLESLDYLEAWLLSRFDGAADATGDDGAEDLDAASRYLGEVMRKLGHGKWRISLDDTEYAFYGVPEVACLGVGKAPPICPMTMISAAADRRTGVYLSTTMGFFVEDYLG